MPKHYCIATSCACEQISPEFFCSEHLQMIPLFLLEELRRERVPNEPLSRQNRSYCQIILDVVNAIEATEMQQRQAA